MIDRDGQSGLGLPVLPENCTVLSVAATGDRVWAATDVGLWQRCGANWRPVTVPLAAPIVSAIVRAGTADDPGGALLVAGLAGGLLCSADDGEHWYAAWVDEIASGVTCFAISPRFAVDRVVLAGTERDGILRSTDGGRHWRLANFGLAGYTILALATPLSWGRREEVFAATDEGIYRSPNAGRAWQRASEGPEAVTQTLAVSPQFALDRTLYAGGEETGLYRSIDAARSWQLWSTEIRNVNCLWLAPDNPRLLVAGNGDGAILRSADGGICWEGSWRGSDAVLTLTESGGALYAGLYQGGLLVSLDRGRSWGRVVGGDMASYLGDAPF